MTVNQETLRLVNTALATGDIRASSVVKIWRKSGDNEYERLLPNVLNYSISTDRRFGAATLNMTCANVGGLLTPTNESSEYNTLNVWKPLSSDVSLSSGTADSVAVNSSTGLLELVAGATSGNWTSPVQQLGDVWDALRIEGKAPIPPAISGSTEVVIYVRYGETATPDANWTGWTFCAGIFSVGVGTQYWTRLKDSPTYLQLQARFRSTSKTVTPSLRLINITAYDTSQQIAALSPLLYFGNKISVDEIVQTTSGPETFNVFTGYINSVTTANGDNTNITIDALDAMKILLDGVIEKPKYTIGGDRAFEPIIIGPETVDLVPATTVDEYVSVEEGELGYVWHIPTDVWRNNKTITNVDIDDSGNVSVFPNGDRKYVNIVKQIMPILKHYDGETGSELDDIPSDKFEVDFARGIFYLKEFVVHESRTETKQDTEWIKEDTGEVDEYGNPIEEDVEVPVGEPYEVEIPRDRITAYLAYYNMDTNRFEDVVADIIKMAVANYEGKPTDKDSLDEEWEPIDANGNPTTLAQEYAVPSTGEPANDLRVTWRSKKTQRLISLDMSYPRSTVPRTVYLMEDKKTYFDAMQEVLHYVDPSYRIYADENGDFYGRYQPIKDEADCELILKRSIELPVSDNEVFTKVVAYGVRRGANINIAKLKAKVTSNPPGGDKKEYGSAGNLFDGSLTNQFGWWVRNSNWVPRDVLTIDLQEPFHLSRVDILVGAEDTGKALEEIGMKISVSSDGAEYFDLVTGGTEQKTGTNQWISIEQGSMDDVARTIPVRYIKITATTTEVNLKITNNYYYWAVREIQVWPDDKIRKEASVFDIVGDNVDNIPQWFATDLQNRLGTKTFVLPVDYGLSTEDETADRAKAYLYDICRNLRTARVQVVYSPHISVGMTITLKDTTLDIKDNAGNPGRLYYVESVNRSMDGYIPSVSLELTSWD